MREEKHNIKNCKKCEKEFKVYRKDRDLCEYCRCLVVCPKCGIERKLATESSANLAKLHDRMCAKCQNKELNKNNEGENNPFYSKHHKLETKLKIGIKNSNRECSDETRKKLSDKSNKYFQENLERTGRKHKSVYECWVDRYGKEIADIKYIEYLYKKKETANSGSKNGMYGIPPPNGAGNGWSGWYNNIYFRSLNELKYLHYLISNNIKFESGELNKHKIKYILNGCERNYFPDFYLVDIDRYIEIKPKALLETQQNKSKFEYAKNILGDRFDILTETEIPNLSDSEILELYNNGNIKWIEKYEKRYKEKYSK